MKKPTPTLTATCAAVAVILGLMVASAGAQDIPNLETLDAQTAIALMEQGKRACTPRTATSRCASRSRKMTPAW